MSLWRVLTSAVNLCMWVVCNSPHKGKISTPSNWNAPLSVQRRQGGQIYATVTHKQVMEIWMITIFTCESICVFTSRSTGCLMKVTSSEQGLSPTALKQRVRWDSWPPARGVGSSGSAQRWSYMPICLWLFYILRHIRVLPLDVTLPGSQITGHGVQSLNGVMIQSFLQGSWQGRTVLGRGPSGHLGNRKKCIMGTLLDLSCGQPQPSSSFYHR